MRLWRRSHELTELQWLSTPSSAAFHLDQYFDSILDDLTCRLEVCGLRGEECVPEKGGKDRGGASGCRGVENGVEEELPVFKKTNARISLQMDAPYCSLGFVL